MPQFGLEGNGLIYSGFFTKDCDFPILNLDRLFDDQWGRNIPTFFGRWRNDVTQRAITSVRPVLTVPGSLAACAYATARNEINGCRWLVPNMVSVRFKAEYPMTWDEAVDDFCDSRLLAYDGMQARASLLGPNGLNFTGSPQVSGPFASFVLAGLGQATMEHLATVSMNGVWPNVMQFDGFLTQLTTGWRAADLYSEQCNVFNTATVLSWSTLTGGDTNPDAVIDEAHDTITLWGVAKSGFAGLNYGEFTLRFMEIVRDEWAAPMGGVDQWEWIVPQGQKRCLREQLACIQPCDGSGVLNDLELRDRFAEYYKSDLVAIYPSDEPIMLSQSRQLTDTIVFGPRMIGGDFTYGWTFRDMDAELMAMRSVLGDTGYQTGLPGSHPLVRHNLDDLRANFETLAFLWKLNSDEDGRCFTPTIETWPGFLVYARHMFLVMEDIECAPSSALPGTASAPVIGPLTIAVTDCADEVVVGDEVTRLTLTLAADPVVTPVAGDLVILTGANDVQVTFTVVSYTALTNLLVVSSEIFATDCATLDPTSVVV